MSEPIEAQEPSLSIRPYEAARDLDRCMAIWRRASEVGHPFLDAATLDADARVVREVYMPAARIEVAAMEGSAVGFIATLGPFIGGLFVDPARHGRGVGRALVLDALTRQPTLDVEVYEANAQARAFYARLGFLEIARRERDDHDRPLPLLRLRVEAGSKTC